MTFIKENLDNILSVLFLVIFVTMIFALTA